MYYEVRFTASLVGLALVGLLGFLYVGAYELIGVLQRLDKLLGLLLG